MVSPPLSMFNCGNATKINHKTRVKDEKHEKVPQSPADCSKCGRVGEASSSRRPTLALYPVPGPRPAARRGPLHSPDGATPHGICCGDTVSLQALGHTVTGTDIYLHRGVPGPTPCAQDKPWVFEHLPRGPRGPCKGDGLRILSHCHFWSPFLGAGGRLSFSVTTSRAFSTHAYACSPHTARGGRPAPAPSPTLARRSRVRQSRQ